MLAAVVFYFLRIRALLVMAITIAAALTWTFALTRLAIGHLNIATSFLTSVVAGNGINVGILYQARYFEERRAGLDPAAAMHKAVGETWKPTAIAALSSAAAYGSLLKRGAHSESPSKQLSCSARTDPESGRAKARMSLWRTRKLSVRGSPRS